MANPILPGVRQPYTDGGGNATVPFHAWCSAVDRALQGGTLSITALAAQFAELAEQFNAIEPGLPLSTTIVGGSGISVAGSLAAGAAIVSLDDLADNGTGTLLAIDRDAQGRIEGTRTPTTTDLAEGTNLYFTDERAQDAVAAALTNSATVTWAYNDGTGQISATAAGGLSNPMTTAGDIIIGGVSGAPTRLAAGTNGDVLTIVAGVPAYAAPSGGGSSGDVFRLNYWTIGAQAAASQVGVSLGAMGTTLNNNTPSSTNAYTSQPRAIYRAAASAAAIAGVYNVNAHSIWRGNATGYGGFNFKATWGAGEGVTNTSCRAFVGILAATGAGTDVQPSTYTDMVGMGWDSADTNIQIMHNDASGTATKVDLGSSFPVPTVDSTEVYSITLVAAPNGSTIDYTVYRWSNATTATGTLSTNLPTATTMMGPRAQISAGGVSTQTSLAMMYLGWKPGA